MLWHNMLLLHLVSVYKLLETLKEKTLYSNIQTEKIEGENFIFEYSIQHKVFRKIKENLICVFQRLDHVLKILILKDVMFRNVGDILQLTYFIRYRAKKRV